MIQEPTRNARTCHCPCARFSLVACVHACVRCAGAHALYVGERGEQAARPTEATKTLINRVERDQLRNAGYSLGAAGGELSAAGSVPTGRVRCPTVAASSAAAGYGSINRVERVVQTHRAASTTPTALTTGAQREVSESVFPWWIARISNRWMGGSGGVSGGQAAAAGPQWERGDAV